jgi:hypothetical protein
LRNEYLVSSKTTRRQHYLPKFLIDRFSDHGMVWRIDKEESRTFRAKSNDVCFARYYYEIPELTANQIEKGLSRVEGKAAAILREFDSGVRPEGLSKEERMDFSIFLTSLMFRTPFFEKALIEGENRSEEKQSIREKIKRLQISAMLNEDWALTFYLLTWQIVDNDSGTEFMLSDCPILRVGLRPDQNTDENENTQPNTTLSIFDPNTALAFPIGPKRILIMTHGQSIDHSRLQREMEEFATRIDIEAQRVCERFCVSLSQPEKMEF